MKTIPVSKAGLVGKHVGMHHGILKGNEIFTPINKARTPDSLYDPVNRDPTNPIQNLGCSQQKIAKFHENFLRGNLEERHNFT